MAPVPNALSPTVVRLRVEARRLAHRLAAGERGHGIEAEVADWRRAWRHATGQDTTQPDRWQR